MSIIEYLHFLHRVYHYRIREEKLCLKVILSENLLGATVLDIGAKRGTCCYLLSRNVRMEAQYMPSIRSLKWRQKSFG